MNNYSITIEIEGSIFEFPSIEAPNEMEAKLIAWETLRAHAVTRKVSVIRQPKTIKNFLRKHLHGII